MTRRIALTHEYEGRRVTFECDADSPLPDVIEIVSAFLIAAGYSPELVQQELGGGVQATASEGVQQ